MPARTTMKALIAHVRNLISDEAGNDQVFTDLQIQEALDKVRQDFVRLPLIPIATLSGGVTSYLDFWSEGLEHWEADASIADSTGAAVEYLASSEPLLGHWIFETSQNKTLDVTGKTYDVYAAASALLRQWAMKVKLDFDFASADQSFKPSQVRAALLDLSKEYAAMSQPTFAKMVRSDA